MADQTNPQQTDPAAPGRTTSEFLITKVMVIASLVMSVLFGALTQIHDSGLVATDTTAGKVIAGLLSALAMLSALLKSVGYVNGRVNLKQTLAENPPAAPAPVLVTPTPAAQTAAAQANAELAK